MALSLPEDIEPFLTEGYDQLNSPGVYALQLSKPPNLDERWDEEYDIRPPYMDSLRECTKCIYVGAAKNVLSRLEDHRDGKVRKAALMRVCDIDRLHTVWFFDNVGRAFERESGIATTLANQRTSWYVHCR